MSERGSLYPFAAQSMGWQGIVMAPNARDALRQLKALASSASLLPSDITSCHRATDEEIAWHRTMGGAVLGVPSCG